MVEFYRRIRVHSSKGTNKDAPLRDLPPSKKEHSPASAAPPQLECKLSGMSSKDHRNYCGYLLPLYSSFHQHAVG